MISTAILVAHALVGWALCGAVMGLGLAFTTELTAQVVHLIAAPVFFAGVSWFYFRRFGYTTPLQTALAFLAIILFLDVFVVSLWIMGNFAMFESVLGTWLPMALIALATYGTGRIVLAGNR